MPDATSKPPAYLPDALRWSVARYPGRGLTVLDRRGRLSAHYDLAELLQDAERAAARLASVGVAPGVPVVVALPTGRPWLEAWLGTLFAGGVPVVIPPASPLHSADETVRRLSSLLARLGSRHLICLPSLRGRIEGWDELPDDLVALTPEDAATLAPVRNAAARSPADPESPALYQLTSGTTGEQRIVQVPHRAVVHNCWAVGRAIAESVGADDLSGWGSANWLPLYHDMGLVGGLLGCTIIGVDVVLTPPEAFLGRPESWLAALGGQGRPTICTAPNFGYQFCVERVDESKLDGLSLSSWGAALVGAEMVRPETLTAFDERFGRIGFDFTAFKPCYGLAEASLAVTLDRIGGYRTAPIPAAAAASPNSEAVCLGVPLEEMEVWAASASGEPLGEGRVGEIRMRGPSVFNGYLNDPQATRETLRNGVLATGDLGFMLRGELYLTGRIKEILLVRGQNLMPHELESIAESEIGGGRCRAGCFTVDHGADGEQIVMIAEAPTQEGEALARIDSAIRRRIGAVLGLPLADLAFVPAGKLPRTTSGKVPRTRLREDYLAGRIPRLETEPD